MILTSQKLSIGYTTSRAILSDLDVQLNSGELVCLMGPNGSGKTTLLRTLSGLLKPLSGSVLLDSKPISQISDSERARSISLVLTDPINTGAMSGNEVVQMGRYPHQDWFSSLSEDDRSKSTQAIKTVNAQEFADQPLYELSDGQRQKILIARALSQDCPIMVLDEPNSHLDLNNRVEIMNVLKSSARDFNKGILMATHELDLALQMADRIWLISESGQLVSGIPEDLVLKGLIDKAFTLKGFDLKTGRVEHQRSDRFSIRLSGDGHLFLWTKNAIERSGGRVSDGASTSITIHDDNNTVKWIVDDSSTQSEFATIEELINCVANLKS